MRRGEISMSKKVYKNLRSNYNLLISKILGAAYYNKEMNRESADDAICQDIIEKWEAMDTSLTCWKIFGIIGWITAAILFLGELATLL